MQAKIAVDAGLRYMKLSDMEMLSRIDLPAFRKDTQREMRKSKQVSSIDQFWSNWLHQMSNAVRTIESSFREVLELEEDEKAGILPMHTPSEEELLEQVEMV